MYTYIDGALPLNSSLLKGKQSIEFFSSLQTAFWGLDICRYFFRQFSQMILSCHFMFRNRWRTSLEAFCYLAVPASDKVRVISVIFEKEIPLPAFIKVKEPEPFINPLWSSWLTNSWCFDHIYFFMTLLGSYGCWILPCRLYIYISSLVENHLTIPHLPSLGWRNRHDRNLAWVCLGVMGHGYGGLCAMDPWILLRSVF